MRRQRALRAPCSQDICLFCALRLLPDIPCATSNRALTIQRRHISVSQRNSQSNGAAPARTAGNGQLASNGRQAFQYGALGGGAAAKPINQTATNPPFDSRQILGNDSREESRLPFKPVVQKVPTLAEGESLRRGHQSHTSSGHIDSRALLGQDGGDISSRWGHRGTSAGSSTAQRGQFRVRYQKVNTLEPTQTAASLDPEITSRWTHLKRVQRSPQGEPSEPERSRNEGFRSFKLRHVPSSDLNQQKNTAQSYVPFNERFRETFCHYCGDTGHVKISCPKLLNKITHQKPPGERPEEKARPKMVQWTPPQPTQRTEHTRLANGTEEQQTSARPSRVPKLGIRGDEEDQPTRQPVRRGRDQDEEDMPRGLARDKARRRQRWEDNDEQANFEERERRPKKNKKRIAKVAPEPKVRPIHLPEFISVSNLAQEVGARFEDFVRKLERLGFTDIAHDHVLNAENAGLIAMEYGFEPAVDTSGETENLFAAPLPDDMLQFPQRPPVVTIMGHVDHGKTTILDYLRKSSIAASEHGGITQHIGAFSVPLSGGKMITFLDTPGHAAFLSMRQRGANVTDIVILVVAADDSVMPQTLEAIKHAKAANVPMIVALNKIDKEEAKPERVKQDLARHGVDVEDFGGEVQVVAVSGKTGQGMDELEEAIVTLSEILDQRAPTDGNVEGWVLESSTRKAGKVATVLIRRGTLRLGDIIVAGRTFARVRTLKNEAGVAIEEAGPGTPVEVDGWRGQPGAGDEVLQAPNEQKASDVIAYRESLADRVKAAEDINAINESRKLDQERREREEAIAKMKKQGVELPPENADAEKESNSRNKEIFYIVKADVAGSAEAVINAVSGLGNAEIRPHILRSGVGGVSQFDIDHAAAAKGHIISFNTHVDAKMLLQAEKAGVKILDQSIIYRVVEDVEKMLIDALPPLVIQRVVGEAEIAQEFRITIKGRQTMPIAGCKVRNGVVSRTNKVRVLRGNEVVYDGTFNSLKNQKKDVTEMRKGTECGMAFEGWEDFIPGDQVQCYEERTEKRTL